MATTEATIRMYQVGELGDCFHIRFSAGDEESNVLIDCGSFRNGDNSKARLAAIVKNIKDGLKGRKLDVVVGTHQHNDHLSGFLHCKDDFKDLVGQVWLSWLDDPKDMMAKAIQKDQKNLVAGLLDAGKSMERLQLGDKGRLIKDVLGFYAADGEAPEVPAKAVEILRGMGQNGTKYLSPGNQLELPGLTGGQVRVYVLGPPRNHGQLFDKDPAKGESYDPHLAAASQSAARLLSALKNHENRRADKDEEQFPFNNIFKTALGDTDAGIAGLYNKPEDKWRRIDNIWLEQANRIALYLDSYTNNSSLVLAFELVKSGKVMLFAADAQTGNWLSWENIKWENSASSFNTQSLLANTVVYKVGHHASHNATLVQGLEAMTHDELVALIPVDRTDGNIRKKGGWKMPSKNLYRRLKEKTGFRVLRMDDGYADECNPNYDEVARENWKKLPGKVTINKKKFFVEYVVHG